MNLQAMDFTLGRDSFGIKGQTLRNVSNDDIKIVYLMLLSLKKCMVEMLVNEYTFIFISQYYHV